MFRTSSSTIAERFRPGLHKLFLGPGQFSSIPQEKQERQLPYSTRLRGGQRKRSTLHIFLSYNIISTEQLHEAMAKVTAQNKAAK
jgi:hypothetical protein